MDWDDFKLGGQYDEMGNADSANARAGNEGAMQTASDLHEPHIHMILEGRGGRGIWKCPLTPGIADTAYTLI